MFFVIESATTNSGTAKAVTIKDTYREAAMMYHQVLSSMMANENVTNGFCSVLEDSGRQIVELTSSYIKPVEINPEDVVDVTNA